MAKRFQRRREDFACAHCGAEVKGDGYTNHCPRCLYSRHVDLNPGDRQADCGGLMEPVAIDRRDETYRILHRCLACGAEKWNRVSPKDDFEVLLRVAEKQSRSI